MTYEALKSPDVMLKKSCIETQGAADALESGRVAGLQYFTEFIPDAYSIVEQLDDPLDCFDHIKNCAVCQ